MRHSLTIFCLVMLFGAILPVSAANADQTFHSERIPLMPVGSAPLQTGFVVDIHANGPQIYALERYVLVGSVPNSTFSVSTSAWFTPGCTGAPFIVLPDATFMTNTAGNGEGSSVIRPAVVQGLHGTTLYLIWTVTNGSATYRTECITVPLD